MKDIPKEFLPKGVGPAQYDPDGLRFLASNLVNGGGVGYDLPIKAWVILTMLDEIDKLESEVEQAEGIHFPADLYHV